MLKQASSGIIWAVDDSHIASPEYWTDVATLQRAQHSHGLVIKAHPSIHSFPWDAPPNIANRHVLRHLKRQAYCKAKVELGTALRGLLQKLQTCAYRGDWHSSALNQTPKQLWSHHNSITEYQL